MIQSRAIADASPLDDLGALDALGAPAEVFAARLLAPRVAPGDQHDACDDGHHDQHDCDDSERAARISAELAHASEIELAIKR
jgi:hypothetical protein